MGVAERRQPGGILVFDRDTLGAQLVEDGRQIRGVPQCDRIDDQPQRG